MTTWTTTTSPFDGVAVTGCCWATDLGEFLAVGDSQGATETIAWSSDGITWTYTASPFDGGVPYAVVRADTLGLYVVVGNNAASTIAIATSPDHVTWTGHGNPFTSGNGIGQCVACKQSTGALVAGGLFATTENIATSPDGATWTVRSTPFNSPSYIQGIDYSPGADRWVGAGYDSLGHGLVAYSDDDGATWTTVTNPMSFFNSSSAVYRDEAGGNWYLVGKTTGGKALAVSSDNGATWTQVTTPLDGGSVCGGAMISVGGGILALGGLDSTNAKQLCGSADAGTTWTFDPSPSVFGSGDTADAFAYSPPLGRVVVGASSGHSGGDPVFAYTDDLSPIPPPSGRVLIAFDDDPLTASPTWTAIDQAGDFPDQFVSGYDTSSGRQTLLARTDTGTATVYINDHVDGLFDPRNVGSPYFGKLDGKQIMLQLYDPVTAIWEPQWRGWIDEASYDIDGSAVNADGDPVNASIQLNCVDVFAALSEYGLTPGLDGDSPPFGMEDGVYYAETVGSVDDRIIEILADVHIDPTRYIVASGNVRVIAVKYDPDEAAITALRDASDAEMPFIANMYVNRHGQFVFRGRYSRFYPDLVAAEPLSEWDFHRWAVGDGKAIVADATRAQMRVLSYTRGRFDIVNVAVCWPQSIEAADMPGQVFADTTSITNYGKHNAPPMSDLLTLEGTVSGFDKNHETAAFAELLVKNKKNPHIVVSSLQVKTVHPSDARATHTWAFLTKSDISHIVNVAVGYPGGTGLSGDSPADDHFIEGRRLRVRSLEPGFDYVELDIDTTPVEWSSDFHHVFPNPFS